MAVATTSNGLPYVGNPDYRGYLSAQAQTQPNSLASVALSLVGNDGKYDPGKLTQYAAGPGGGGDAANVKAIQDYITSSYGAYSGLANKGAVVLGANTGAGTGAAPAAGAPNTDAADLAYLDEQDNQLRKQLDSTKSTLNDGILQLDDSYNQSRNRTTQDQATADTGFNTNRTQTTQDKLKAVDTINTGARTLSDSIRRILGLASGSNSSAYQLAAPHAIATDTTQKRSDVNDTYARNYKSIDDSQAATDLKFSRALDDLLTQRKGKESDLRSGILTQEQGIESQLGTNALTRSQIKGTGYAGARAAIAPFSQGISDRQSAIDKLFSQFRTPFTLQDTAPVAANIDSFKTPGTTIDTSGTPNSAAADTLSPYLQALLKKFQPQTA